MAHMVSEVIDADSMAILASCPFYKENPFCVNSCALFAPEVQVIEGESITDYRYGKCSLGNGLSQKLVALTDEEEAALRKRKGFSR